MIMLKAANRMGLVFFPAFDWAISATHPEREERLLYTQDQVFEEGLLDVEGIVELKPDVITAEDIQRVHFCVPGPMQVCTESHLISGGGATAIGRAVMDKRVERGFALVRPPGHHACRVVHGARGFCNINIEAIMIEQLRAKYGVERVAIVDTDCHHGDGTQDIYWHDPDTLFISIHQDGRTLYPGSGFVSEYGGPNAAGTTINIPLPPETCDEGLLYAIEHGVLPILEDFQPQLIINSAGQDNHYSDPITNMSISARGYARLTELLKADIAVLEGGYSIEGALPYVNAGIIMAMAGIDYSHLHEPDYNPDYLTQPGAITKSVEKTCAEVLQVWNERHSLRPKGKNPGDLISRKRSIFYDTDNIMETQEETIRVCDECGGVIKIDSTAARRMLGVHVPRKACEACRDLGERWYDEAEPAGKYQYIFLQDRYNERFVQKEQ